MKTVTFSRDVRSTRKLNQRVSSIFQSWILLWMCPKYKVGTHSLTYTSQIRSSRTIRVGSIKLESHGEAIRGALLSFPTMRLRPGVSLEEQGSTWGQHAVSTFSTHLHAIFNMLPSDGPQRGMSLLHTPLVWHTSGGHTETHKQASYTHTRRNKLQRSFPSTHTDKHTGSHKHFIQIHYHYLLDNKKQLLKCRRLKSLIVSH